MMLPIHVMSTQRNEKKNVIIYNTKIQKYDIMFLNLTVWINELGAKKIKHWCENYFKRYLLGSSATVIKISITGA